MTNLSRTASLFRRVVVRMRLASYGFRLYVAFLVVCGCYGVGLLLSRLTGVLNGWFDAVSVDLFSVSGKPYGILIPSEQFLLVPAAAVLIAAVWLALRWRISNSDAARKVDWHQRTKDLFLTMSMLDRSLGEYGPLVAGAAEQKAPSVKAANVVPFNWQRRLGYSALGVLAVALTFNVPQLDPFGKVAKAGEQAQERKTLEQMRKANKVRIAQLQRTQKDNEDGSPEVKKAVENLKNNFRKAKPTQRKKNLQRLAASQKELGKRYQKIRAEKLKDLLSHAASSQQFGRKDQEMLKKWSRELQEGSTDSLKKEMDALKDDLKRLMKEKDLIKRAELAKKLEKRLKNLERFASEHMNSKPLMASLQRAMKQLQMADGDLSEEAMKELAQSLELSKLELEEIAQSAQDLKRLEQALKTLQMAKRLNNNEKLDGQQCENCNTMADYEELYAELMEQMGISGEGDDKGDGTGGRGMGRGGKVEEDDSAITDFKAEQSKSQITAGKVLLSMKTKGLSDRGDAKKDYLNAVRRIKQGVSEAIVQEQVPPGYHEGIKGYFDKIDNSLEASDDGKK